MSKFFIPILIILSACIGGANKSSENVLARVYDEYLYESEIQDVIPAGTNPKDSILIAQNYLNNWISQKLILFKAQRNLVKEDMLFEKQLEDYRNSLIIYSYETKLISQRLDTIVTDTDIETYYNDNIGNFQLKDNIVKVYYARFNSKIEEINKVRGFFNSNIPEYRDSIEVYIENLANLFYLDDETWILFDDVLKYVPINTYNQESYLKNHRRIEITDDENVYFVNFADFKIKDGVSPLSFEKENIRQIIINKRKLDIISKMRDEVFQSALENNEFEIY